MHKVLWRQVSFQKTERQPIKKKAPKIRSKKHAMNLKCQSLVDIIFAIRKDDQPNQSVGVVEMS